MHAKTVDLREFYDAVQGRVVQRVLRHQIRAFWPEAKGLRVLGVGYALPYLKPFMAEAERVAALMPGGQGAVFWPPDEKGLVCIYEEGDWPVETSSVDRIIAIHAFQDGEAFDALLRESWRVLTGQGRLMLIAPNRTGLWARTDSTPFGDGAPWSMGQMRQALKDNLFVPERMERALFVPPTSSRLMMATAPVWEKMGRRFFNAFGGVNIVEASKQLYAGTLAPVTSMTAARRKIRPAVVIVPERGGGV
jgi:hypothetical protein